MGLFLPHGCLPGVGDPGTPGLEGLDRPVPQPLADTPFAFCRKLGSMPWRRPSTCPTPGLSSTWRTSPPSMPRATGQHLLGWLCDPKASWDLLCSQ